MKDCTIKKNNLKRNNVKANYTKHFTKQKEIHNLNIKADMNS